METFAEAKEFVDDPGFEKSRDKAIAGLPQAPIDAPIQNLIKTCSTLPFCYTMQCCWGHFVFPGQSDPDSITPLPETCKVDEIEYRIAYIAFCIQNSDAGRKLKASLARLVKLNPEYIQFLSADWFWNQRVNTFQLQIEPKRFKRFDTCIIPFSEAKLVEKVKAEFYQRLEDILSSSYMR